MENLKQTKLVNSKYNQFQTDMSNGNYIEKKLNHFFKSEFEEIFSEILILNKDQFIAQIKNGVELSLKDMYSDNCLSNEKLINMMDDSLQSITKDYTNIYNILTKHWNHHEKIGKRRAQSEEIVKIFRKHCINTDEYAYHNCEFKNNYFIAIRDEDNKIKYVICIQCKRVYFSNFILCRCYKCNIDYYTNILNNIEEANLLPATWDNYHCPQIINEKMKCIKCKDIFYLNMKTDMLVCQNKKCGFISKPLRILWTCNVCKQDFKSGCLPYNPLDLIVIKRVIKQTLLFKHLAHPNKMPCCKLNVFFTSFYHKNSCRGILYVGELNNSLIIVCDKCHAINFYDRFIWTCPECGKRFRDKGKMLNNNTSNNTIINTNNNTIVNTNNNTIVNTNNNTIVNTNNNTINNNNNNNNNNNQNEINNEKGERKSSYKNIISSRKMFKDNSINNKNSNTNTTIAINEDSPRRRKLKDIKETNNSGYLNFNGVKSILNKEENSQTIENNKIQNNNEIKRERTNYFQKYREKKEKERKEREKKDREEKEEKEKEKKEKEEKVEKEEKENEEITKNEITERKKYREKRNLLRNDVYHKKQIDENGKKSRFKFGYNLTEENMAKKDNSKNTANNAYEGDKKKTEENNNVVNDNNNVNNNKNHFRKSMKHHNNNNEEEIEGDDEEEIEEEEIENHYKYKNNKINNQKKENVKKRRPEGRKTRGQEIKEELPEIAQEIQNIKENEKNVPMSNIEGISEHLLNYINKRMNFILSRSKIPIINIEEYVLYKKLGEGSYGVIYSVFKQNEKKLYALKKIIAHTLNEIDEFTKEFELVHSCEHDNIMKIYGICLRVLDSTTYALFVLMEYSNGDWDKEIRIHLAHRKNYTEIELIHILYQLTKALLFMQEKLKVSHRDIKPQNILTFDGGVYKLADFGEAKEVKISKQLNTLRGTELYMSPALYDGLKNEKDDVSHNPFKSDVFSLGFCFLYAAALNFNLLYEVRDVMDSRIINLILHKHLKNNYSERFISILGKMLEIDENKRYDFPSLIKEITTYYHINKA